MQIVINNETNLNIFQIHDLMSEYLRWVYPKDNGEMVYPTMYFKDGTVVSKTEDGFKVSREVGK